MEKGKYNIFNFDFNILYKVKRKEKNMKHIEGLDEIRRYYFNPKITEFAFDAEDYGKTAIDWCNLYLELLDYNRNNSLSAMIGTKKFPKFYIKDLEKALNEVVPRELSKALKKFLDLEGKGRRRYLTILRDNDIALKNMAEKSTAAGEYLKSFRALYIYHSRIHEIMDNISKKIKDYEKYSVFECVKYAHIYYRYIKDFQFMPGEIGKRDTVLSKKEIWEEEKRVPIQDVRILEEEWERFYKKIPDEDIIIPMIQKFIWETDAEINEVISADGQLYEDRFYTITYGNIRKIKEAHFSSGEWFFGDYCRNSEIAKISDKLHKQLQMSYKKYSKEYEWEAEKNQKLKILLPAQGIKEIEVPCFAEKNFKDPFEMMQYCHLINYMK